MLTVQRPAARSRGALLNLLSAGATPGGSISARTHAVCPYCPPSAVIKRHANLPLCSSPHYSAFSTTASQSDEQRSPNTGGRLGADVSSSGVNMGIGIGSSAPPGGFVSKKRQPIPARPTERPKEESSPAPSSQRPPFSRERSASQPRAPHQSSGGQQGQQRRPREVGRSDQRWNGQPRGSSSSQGQAAVNVDGVTPGKRLPPHLQPRRSHGSEFGDRSRGPREHSDQRYQRSSRTDAGRVRPDLDRSRPPAGPRLGSSPQYGMENAQTRRRDQGANSAREREYDNSTAERDHRDLDGSLVGTAEADEGQTLENAELSIGSQAQGRIAARMAEQQRKSGSDRSPSYKLRREREELEREQQQQLKDLEARAQMRAGKADKRVVSAEPIRTELGLPAFMTVSSLAKAIGTRMRLLQNNMTAAGYEDTRPDLLLPFDDAALLVSEYGLTAVPLNSQSDAFDIYPSPPLPEDQRAQTPLRPPVVTIMGHVDHGKTTLLDKLRSASVAAGEAGGITQHIGAFSVPVSQRQGSSSSGGVDTVTFLDTPGHAAFSAMRGRGAAVTDIVVLVVAADDGVMPQTKEVIQLVESLREEEAATSARRRKVQNADVDQQAASKKEEEVEESTERPTGLQLVVALNKTDKTDANVERVKSELMSNGVHLEEYGGEVPCVEVSGKTGAGLPLLEETLAALAEMADLRAERDGIPAEGWVVESRTDKGRGNTATVLVKRGSLRTGDFVIAGQSWARVRALLDSAGKPTKKPAFPGDAVVVTGWRTLPSAGDEVLGVVDASDGSSNAETLAKRAVETRQAIEERRKLIKEAEGINDARRLRAEEEEAQARAAYEERAARRQARLEASELGLTAEEYAKQAQQALDKAKAAGKEALPKDEVESEKKELRLIVRADFSGTVEAVVGAISGIGNTEVGVKIIAQGVGDPTDGDLALAQAVQGHILAFNVKASKAMQNAAAKSSVKIQADDVIYRLMSWVSAEASALLPPRIETRVTGEAIIAQIFSIAGNRRTARNIAGCRVTNGSITANTLVRVMRERGGRKQDEEEDRKVLWQGKLQELKHGKREVDEIRKGTECGMSFGDAFQDFKEGDIIQAIKEVEVSRTL
ncbi:translation initiation factor if-2 [Ceraceosorus bombacis]|uniref:Translation initiation factor IF-2, mitochondrial n=1 Tax=Ceraceosorus bombacis TaxID=401625 RepID=A0A0P1BT24_9BASI|nr:translation initiation factor if-2 [Ceraceosorus bombacis]